LNISNAQFYAKIFNYLIFKKLQLTKREIAALHGWVNNVKCTKHTGVLCAFTIFLLIFCIIIVEGSVSNIKVYLIIL